ncbi:hypothetical protein GE061_000052 [Apolygus lucorum]|uniref:Uncharacterized protein n=1 Tax=Apolygus lucorum TaxID=248454 RepID=A0A6A4K5F1_APOLU|nr:hypothetical protein GE061_000052 [Apolygus lucorum]
MRSCTIVLAAAVLFAVCQAAPADPSTVTTLSEADEGQLYDMVEDIGDSEEPVMMPPTGVGVLSRARRSPRIIGVCRCYIRRGRRLCICRRVR